MNELALFAGAGGGILGGKLLGWRTICAVEWEPYPASVLCARQNDGFLPAFPIWDDVQTFDGKPWRGLVDVVSGGFPCQDISSAGKGAGIDGERSGMWKHMARIIGEIRPRYAFVENSPLLVGRGLAVVLGDLAEMGYDAKWGVLGAVDAGAPHRRDRIWIMAELADSASEGLERVKWAQFEGDGTRLAHSGKKMAYADSQRFAQLHDATESTNEGQSTRCNVEGGRETQWWTSEPNVGRVAHGVAARVDRLKAIGNGQVPLCAATAWKLLTQKL